MSNNNNNLGVKMANLPTVKLRALTVLIPIELHKKLTLNKNRTGISLSFQVNKFIEEGLENEASEHRDNS